MLHEFMNEDLNTETFIKLKNALMNIDPVNFCESYLTLDGKDFRINGSGYKPFSDMYRYIGVKALENTAKPVIIVKGRQVGGTTMATALMLYYMCSGLFGAGNKPPIRIMHAFPTLLQAKAHSKTKLNPMIIGAKPDRMAPKANGATKSIIQAHLDQNNTSDSLEFKQFIGGNHIWIESTGLDGNRLRGRSVDVIFYDECFPHRQLIKTEVGDVSIGELHELFHTNQTCPKVLTFNEKIKEFEYKAINNSWNRGERNLFEMQCGEHKIQCTENHKFLTNDGWKAVGDMYVGEIIKTHDPGLELPLGIIQVTKITNLNDCQSVFDLSIEDNHNFITTVKDSCGLIAHNCQDTNTEAINNTSKSLATSKYGPIGLGVQVFFGTPKKKGSDFEKMWKTSTQQLFYLGCLQCKEYFPLYTPGTDEWEKIWLYDFTVKCTHCGHLQDKREAAEIGKWILPEGIDPENAKMVGYHINQLYIPFFNKQYILDQKPENNPIQTERTYRNEVMGEFFHGDSSTISKEEIVELCGDPGRKYRSQISMGDEKMVLLGIDYGAKSDAEQLANPDTSTGGKSYSTAVVLTAKGPNLLHIDFAKKFHRNDFESKKGIIDQIMRQYSVNLAVGDIGFSHDFSGVMHTAYGDRYIVSRASGSMLKPVKYRDDLFPKEIQFKRNYYIEEMFDMMKKGNIRFPLGSYEKVAWLIDHCSSMDVKVALSKTGEHRIDYVKGSKPNDGFMSLLNAYLGYKFLLTGKFTSNNPFVQEDNFGQGNKPLITGGYMSF